MSNAEKQRSSAGKVNEKGKKGHSEGLVKYK